jgi:hypothetical protein
MEPAFPLRLGDGCWDGWLAHPDPVHQTMTMDQSITPVDGYMRQISGIPV